MSTKAVAHVRAPANTFKVGEGKRKKKKGGHFEKTIWVSAHWPSPPRVKGSISVKTFGTHWAKTLLQGQRHATPCPRFPSKRMTSYLFSLPHQKKNHTHKAMRLTQLNQVLYCKQIRISASAPPDAEINQFFFFLPLTVSSSIWKENTCRGERSIVHLHNRPMFHVDMKNSFSQTVMACSHPAGHTMAQSVGDEWKISAQIRFSLCNYTAATRMALAWRGLAFALKCAFPVTWRAEVNARKCQPAHRRSVDAASLKAAWPRLAALQLWRSGDSKLSKPFGFKYQLKNYTFPFTKKINNTCNFILGQKRASP